jgi:hypothetical protein
MLHRGGVADSGPPARGNKTSRGRREAFWMYSAERCIVDAMRLERIAGRNVVLSALLRYMRRQSTDPLRLTELARQLGPPRR